MLRQRVLPARSTDRAGDAAGRPRSPARLSNGRRSPSAGEQGEARSASVRVRTAGRSNAGGVPPSAREPNSSVRRWSRNRSPRPGSATGSGPSCSRTEPSRSHGDRPDHPRGGPSRFASLADEMGVGAEADLAFSQHQGTGRLLGGGLHARRGDAGPGRAHPGAPRVDAGLGPGGRRQVRSRAGPAIRRQRSLRRRHPPQRPHPRSAGVPRRVASWPGLPTGPTMPMSGGEAPGSMPAHATRLEQEGHVVAPIVAVRRRRCGSRSFTGPFLDATRTPAEREGDLAAQMGANEIGAARLARMIEDRRADRVPSARGGIARLRRATNPGRPRPVARRGLPLLGSHGVGRRGRRRSP